MKRLLCVFALFSLGLLSLAVDWTPEIEAKVEEAVKAWNTDTKPGGVVGVVIEGKVVFAKGYGLANMEHGVKNSRETVMDVGSVSKQFTAACIHVLADQGKLGLDDEIQKHLPEIPKYAQPITIRNLLNHTSGMRDYLSVYLAIFGRPMVDKITEEEAYELICRNTELNSKPLEKWNYCNTGYFLLAKIVRNITKKSLSGAAKELIFTPLGMTNSRFDENRSAIVKNRAESYDASFGPYTAMRASTTPCGDGGMLTTIDDMAKWVTNMGNDKLCGGKLIEQMSVKPKLLNGEEFPYGSGLFLDELSGHKRIQHGGDWLGFHAQVTYYPTEKFGVMCFGNDGTQLSKQFADDIAKIMLGIKPADKPAEGEKLPLPKPDELKPYLGLYKLETANLVVEFKMIGDAFYAAPTGQPQLPLIFRGGRTFEVDGVPAKFTFAEPKEGQSPSVMLEQGPAKLNGPRVAKDVFVAADYEAFVGTFYSKELDFEFAFAVDGEKINVTRGGRPYALLTLDKRDEGVLAGGMKVRLERDANGQVTGFRLDAGRAENILFVKK